MRRSTITEVIKFWKESFLIHKINTKINDIEYKCFGLNPFDILYIWVMGFPIILLSKIIRPVKDLLQRHLVSCAD